MKDEISKSDIVMSKAGRDKGRLMYVLQVNDGLLSLADGKVRKVEKPKIKKAKHVVWVTKAQELERPTNSEIRKLLAQIIQEESKDGQIAQGN